jgi:malate dehydrogenase (oxaloacetate-decarboxylating)
MTPITTAKFPVMGDTIDTWLSGALLLEQPLLNKGTAFTEEERHALHLSGLLPPHVDTLDVQCARAYGAFLSRASDLDRYIYLRQLQDENEVLFYRLVVDHVEEMLPLIYTPVVGTACQYFSHIYRRPRGLFISYPYRDRIDQLLEHATVPQVEVIVVTDGERILGLGDQGVGGMGIPIGKLSLYTACAGIHPATTLPIVLDCGTNNAERLADPLYLGWRHERIRGEEYDAFVEAFVQAVMRKFPNVLLQWEDFSRDNAQRLLERYQDKLCTFNDDIQGTAGVTAGALFGAVRAAGTRLRDQRVVIFGAGSAGCGVGELLVLAMQREGLSEVEARRRMFLLNRQGLVHDGLSGLTPAAQRFAQPRENLAHWKMSTTGAIGLMDVVVNAKPSVLIGVSGQAHTFTEPMIRSMAEHTKRPIIFPLSNPTACSEATPADLLKWTDGRAIVATGSPFKPVEYGGRTYQISQCNNLYIFPAMGLGVLAVGAKRVTNEMFMAAAEALASYTSRSLDDGSMLLPPVRRIREVARGIALAVALQAIRQGVASRGAEDEVDELIDRKMWNPRYLAVRARA